jgi:hypothetical protein
MTFTFDGGETISSLLNLKKYIPMAPNPDFNVGLFMIKGTAVSVLLD